MRYLLVMLLCACGERDVSRRPPGDEPGPTGWRVPDCAAITGTAGVTYTTDEGATLAPTAAPPSS